jgi:hypothetical protein
MKAASGDTTVQSDPASALAIMFPMLHSGDRADRSDAEHDDSDDVPCQRRPFEA